MPHIIVPRRGAAPVLYAPAQRALYDFNASSSLDFSGNGFKLTRSSSSLVDLGIPGGRTGKRLIGTSDDIDTIGTSLIGDTDHFYVWAWIYIRNRSATTNIFGRGKDGSGSGWSAGLTASGSSVSASIVLTNPSTLQWTATNTVTMKPGWNFVAMIVQMTYSTEPSHVSAIYETSQARTGLTGHTQLRSSTIGSYVGAGASQGVGASVNPIGAVGIKLVNGLTEDQALAELRAIRLITAPAFLGATPSLPVFFGGNVLWDKIDETTAVDSDYIWTPTRGSEAEVKLGTITTPLPASGNTVRVRAKDDGTSSTLTTKLVQGTTVIATWTDTLSGTLTTYPHSLTSGEASSITDGADLRLRFRVD
jgi:hypothetical protein